MGEGLTDYKVKQIIEALKGIERQLKIGMSATDFCSRAERREVSE